MKSVSSSPKVLFQLPQTHNSISFSSDEFPTETVKRSSFFDIFRGFRFKNFVYTPQENRLDSVTKFKYKFRLNSLLTGLGFCLGYGNIWRLSRNIFRNGGGNYFIPFIFFNLVFGLFLVGFEISLGQYSQKSTLKMWQVIPLFSGIGWTVTLMLITMLIHYGVLLTWNVFYLVLSLTLDSPWNKCHHSFNTPNCRELVNILKDSSGNYTLSTTEWFYNFVTKSFDKDQPVSISSFGYPNVYVFCVLILIWCLSLSVVFAGKYFCQAFINVSTISSFLLSIIILCLTVTLPGAEIGLKYIITPKLSEFFRLDTFVRSIEHVLFTLSIGCSGLTTIGSLNDFHDNFILDSFIIVFCDFLISVISSISVFSVMGFIMKIGKSDEFNTDWYIDSLLYCNFPTAFSSISSPNVWSFLYFLLLITLGINGIVFEIQCIFISLIEYYSWSLTDLYKAQKAILGLVIVIILIDIILISPNGMYFFELIDGFVIHSILPIIVLFEFLIIGFFYGLDKYQNDLYLMTGMVISLKYIRLHYFFILTILVMPIIFHLCTHEGIVVFHIKQPIWLQLTGYIIIFLILSPIIFHGVLSIRNVLQAHPNNSLKEVVNFLLTSNIEWGYHYDYNQHRFFHKYSLQNKHVSFEVKQSSDEFILKNDQIELSKKSENITDDITEIERRSIEISNINLQNPL